MAGTCCPPWFKVFALVVCLCGIYYANFIMPEQLAEEARLAKIAAQNAEKARYLKRTAAIDKEGVGTESAGDSRAAARERAQRKMEEVLRSPMNRKDGSADLVRLLMAENGQILGDKQGKKHRFNKETMAFAGRGNGKVAAGNDHWINRKGGDDDTNHDEN